MTHPLPLFPPLFPNAAWWRAFLEHRLAGNSSEKCISEANAAAGYRPRGWLRISLREGAELSLPVAGGASTLKNHPADSWVTARESAREWHKTIATIATLYGRQPFFPLLRDILEPPFGLSEGNEGARVEEVCMEFFQRVERTLGLDDPSLLSSLRKALRERDSNIIKEAERLSRGYDFSLSFIDSLMRYGQDAIFLLAPTFFID